MNNNELLTIIKDPKEYLERFTKIKSKEGGLVPFKLNPAQLDLMNAIRNNSRVITLKARQLGISTAVAGYIYHSTITTPGITSVLIGYNADLAAEFLDKIKTFYKTTPDSLKPQIHYNSRNEISFPALDSKILVLPSSENVGRGYTIFNCLVSELAFFEKAEEKMLAIENAVPKNGKIIIESCVTGDTIVLTDRGPRYVGEIHDWGNHELGFSTGEDIMLDGHYGIKHTNTYYNSGVQNGYRMKTRTGNELGMSSVHKMYVLRGEGLEFVCARDIKVGDFLATKTGQELWGNNDRVVWAPSKYRGRNKQNIKLFSPGVITEELAYLIGVTLGDGYIDFKHGRVVITTVDRDISDFLKNNKLGLHFTVQKDGIHFNCKNDSFVEFLSEFIKMPHVRAPQKYIPSIVFEWSRDNIIAVLRGLFDTDGSCRRDRGTVSFYSTSKKLVNQTQILLLNLGIISRVSSRLSQPTKKVKVTSLVYALVLNNKYSEMFHDKIGFNIKRKALNIIRTRTKKGTVLPGIGRVIHDNRKELGLRLSDVARGKNKSLFSSTGNVTDTTLKEILNVCRNKESSLLKGLNDLLDYNYFYDEVVDKVPISEEVFDFTVEDGHTVTYNGLVGHQTPQGVGNLYHRMWMAEDNGYVKKEYGWWWLYTEEELEMIRKRINDPLRFAQEYEMEFLSTGRPVFDLQIVKNMAKAYTLKVGDKHKDAEGVEHVVVEEDGLRIYKQPAPNDTFCCGADVAEGVTGGDFSTAVIWNRATGEEVAMYRGHIPADKFGTMLNRWGRKFNNALMVTEINNHGLTTVTTLRNLMYPQLYFRQAKFDTVGTSWGDRIGWKTTKTTRPLMIDDFAEAMRDRDVVIHSKEIYDEMLTFVYDDGANMVTTPGFHDDLIFACAIGLQGFKVLYGGRLDQIEYQDHLPTSTPY